jgi:hypothetical protein
MLIACRLTALGIVALTTISISSFKTRRRSDERDCIGASQRTVASCPNRTFASSSCILTLAAKLVRHWEG